MSMSVTANPTRSTRVAHLSLWVVQILLALVFGMAGLTKATQPIAALAAQMDWTATAPVALVRFIGISELLGAVGIVLPALTRIKPGLTALAAAGLATVMLFALVFHVQRGEIGMVPVVLILGGLALFVAVGRTKVAPIQPR